MQYVKTHSGEEKVASLCCLSRIMINGKVLYCSNCHKIISIVKYEQIYRKEGKVIVITKAKKQKNEIHIQDSLASNKAII